MLGSKVIPAPTQKAGEIATRSLIRRTVVCWWTSLRVNILLKCVPVTEKTYVFSGHFDSPQGLLNSSYLPDFCRDPVLKSEIGVFVFSLIFSLLINLCSSSFKKHFDNKDITWLCKKEIFNTSPRENFGSYEQRCTTQSRRTSLWQNRTNFMIKRFLTGVNISNKIKRNFFKFERKQFIRIWVRQSSFKASN